MKLLFDSQPIEIVPTPNGYDVLFDGQTHPVEIARLDKASGQIEFRIGGIAQSAYISFDGAKRWITLNGQTRMLTKTSTARRGARQDSTAGLTAPMPGQVRSVAVGVGEAVKKGQTLLTMEAMKMEIKIQALMDGKIKTIFVAPGATVEREQTLVEMAE
ncbi:MAG: hypothetical protein IT310_05485 [Anaerolineales bacterium]|nr:hypothetical protein [Anaerolineales bacterium]